MILDTGFCTIYAIENVAEPGCMPVEGLTQKFQSWYCELNFETAPSNVAAHEGISASNRIRIIQDRSVTNNDVAVLSTALPPPDGTPRYNITRAYHGTDDETGQPITDLTRERLVEE